MSTYRVDIDPTAMPNYTDYTGDLHLNWPCDSDDDLDQLVRFVYGNQGNLFVEDAVLWTQDHTSFRIRRDDPWERVHGTWEQDLVVSLTPNMVETIAFALAEQEDGRDEANGHGPSARASRIAVLHALGRL